MDHILQINVIKSPQSEWASLVLFFWKGLLAPFIYLTMESECSDHQWPVSNTASRPMYWLVLQRQIFPMIAANYEFYQIEIDYSDVAKLPSTSHHVLYQFIEILFYVKNGPSTSQRGMDNLSSTVKWQFSIVYLDDTITIFRYVAENVDQRTFNILFLAGRWLVVVTGYIPPRWGWIRLFSFHQRVRKSCFIYERNKWDLKNTASHKHDGAELLQSLERVAGARA